VGGFGRARLADCIINDCGLRDPWPTVALLTSFGMGSAGRHGLVGMTGIDAGIVNRYFPVGHSGFFSDEFMARHWVPILTRGERPSGPALVPPTPSPLTWLARMADPVKLVIAALLVVAPLVAWQEQQRRLFAAQADAANERALKAEAERDTAKAEQRAKNAEAEMYREGERARQSEAGRRLEELRRKESDVRRREEEAARLLADATNILYRLPEQALLRTIQAAAIDSGPAAARARAAALAVLRKRWENDRAWPGRWRQVTSGWFVPPRFEGSLTATFSSDGARLLFATPTDSHPGAADVYFVSFDTLAMVRLEPPDRRRNGSEGVLRNFTFGSLGRKIYILRGRGSVESYSVDGTFERSFALNLAKEFLTAIDGVDADRSIVVGDTEGNVWLASASGPGGVKPIVRDYQVERRLPRRLVTSPSGRAMILLHEELAQPDPVLGESAPQASVGRASVWPIGTTGEASAIPLDHGGSVLDVAVSPARDADLFVTAGDDGRTILWNVAKKRPRCVAVFEQDGTIASVTFSDAGDQVLTVTSDGEPRVWPVPQRGTCGSPASSRVASAARR
jgi:hypothetical protein